MLDQNSELFQLLKKMVSFDSTDGNEAGISDFLAQNARDMGMDEVVQQEALPGLKNVIAVKTFGKGGKSVVLNSHMDVVPPADGWETDPYELVIKDGRAYGRGSTDAKGPLACLTHAVKRIIENPQGINGTIVYTAVIDEESHSTGARRLVEQKREGSKLKIVLDGQQIPVQIKEKAGNLLNNDILHLSFQALQADQKVNSVIHIFLTNTEKVTDALERMLMEIPYASLPEDMIDTITVDVEGMPCGTVLTVGDIPELNSGKLDLQADKTEIVLRISDKTRGPSRAAKQTEE